MEVRFTLQFENIRSLVKSLRRILQVFVSLSISTIKKILQIMGMEKTESERKKEKRQWKGMI